MKIGLVGKEMKTVEIKIRDPFILPNTKEKVYYMYGTTDQNIWSGKAVGFDMYESHNLDDWKGPYSVFRPSSDFWADENFWAPEVYFYNSKYYMLASFKTSTRCRAVHSLVSDSPYGPFIPCAKQPLTPSNWECLDGTLFIEDEEPWLIFCREWLQVKDGEIWLAKLDKNLTKIVDTPIKMFTASKSGWSTPINRDETKIKGENYVTDGPFFCRLATKELICLWSSHAKNGYAIGQAKSSNGKLSGEWEHAQKPLFDEDGGHGMVFRSFENIFKLAIHRPNTSQNEHLYLIDLKEKNGWLAICT